MCDNRSGLVKPRWRVGRRVRRDENDEHLAVVPTASSGTGRISGDGLQAAGPHELFANLGDGA